MPETSLPSFGSRLVAEAVRLCEEARGAPFDEPEADHRAREAQGDLEQRIIVRSGALSVAPAIRDALAHVSAISNLAIAAAVVVAALAGIATAQLVLSATTERPANFFQILVGLLGAPTLMLVVWALLMVISPGSAASLGGAVLSAGRSLARRINRGPLAVAAVHAAGTVYAGSAVGRWTLSAVSHGLWLAYLSGAIASVLILLSTREFTFAWATTILSDRDYVALTRTLAAVPELLGFPGPDSAQIANSRWPGGGVVAAEARAAWGGLLVGCLVAYGALPRLALLILCWVQRRRARRRFRLDTALPGYARLQPRLQPIACPVGIVDADIAGRAASAMAAAAPAIRADGLTAVLGLEIERPSSGWPPEVSTITWLDLGFVDNRDDRQRCIDALRSLSPPARALVVVCSLATTPDRGTRAFLADVQSQTGVPVLLLLSDGQRVRERDRTDNVLVRIDDWRRLAVAAAIPADRLIEVDLNHLTVASRNRLRTWLGGSAGDGTGAEGVPATIDAAFAEIVKHVRQWRGAPSIEQQAALHRALGDLYKANRRRWREMLRLNVDTGLGGVEEVKASAQRMLDLLPSRLRLRPRWLAASAAAGGLACVAAAMLVAPAAIAALPAWIGLGAAAALSLPMVGDGEKAPAGDADDLGEAVAAAALSALVWHLQGRDEAAISRILDAVLGDGDPPDIDNGDTAAEWLAVLADRLDDALAAEAER